ncbi:hypothetical protein TSOC_009759, partial [Tetrabaena socialis]
MADSADSPPASQDDDLAAAFEGGFEDEFAEDAEGLPPADGIDSPDEDGGEDGQERGESGSSSEVDLDEMADVGYTEVEALEQEVGVTARPPKRQRTVTFDDDDDLDPAGAGPSTSTAAAAAGGARGR